MSESCLMTHSYSRVWEQHGVLPTLTRVLGSKTQTFLHDDTGRFC